MTSDLPNLGLLPSSSSVPDAAGHFGVFGGRFVPEALIAALDELATAYTEARTDPAFLAELDHLARSYTGRPTPLTEVPRFAAAGGAPARIVLKREDLNHTGSHKINNVLGQALLTKRMGKKRIIAETGAGQHGVASATAAGSIDCIFQINHSEKSPLSTTAFKSTIGTKGNYHRQYCSRRSTPTGNCYMQTRSSYAQGGRINTVRYRCT